MKTHNVLPNYFFTKRQIKGIKGYELFYNLGSGFPENLGFFKTKKQATNEILCHKDGINKKYHSFD